MTDDSMPPRPECEFDFDLPHGIDAEETEPFAQDHNATPDEEPLDSNMGHTDDHLDELFEDGRDNAQKLMNYDTLAQGFSDDEEVDKAFDRSWTAHQARKSSPKHKKKSPRRSEDGDGDDEGSPRAKRPRKSLFGGPVEHIDTQQSANYPSSQSSVPHTPITPGHGIGHGMSSLNLDAPDDRPINLGFGLDTSDRDSLSPVPSRAPSEESFIIPPDDQPAYDLRKNINRAKTSTYLDTDKTGNYDPTREARIKALKLQRAKAAKAAKKKDKSKPKAPKHRVLKLIVKLRFTAFGNVRNNTNDEQNWPDGWSDNGSDYERDTKEIREFRRRNTPGVSAQAPIEDPLGQSDDLTGHPAVRGCYSCRQEDKECSMVDGGTYPCNECDDDEIECEPILAPVVKGRCKQCEADGEERCSYEDDPEQAICDHCVRSEQVCEALPPNGYKTPRASIDDIMYGPNRKHVQCTFCRLEKKRCSLKKKTDKPPCKFCKKNGIGCTFYDLPTMKTGKQKTSKQKAPLGPTEGPAPEVSKPSSEFFSTEDLEDMYNEDEEPVVREPTPEIDMEDNDGNRGVLTKIKTSFAHPIKFSGLVSVTPDCNFCEMPAYSFTGLFETEVHVIRWFNGLGYTEVGGGHREVIDETTMCQTCSMGRAQIVSCDQHDIRRVYADDTTPHFDDLIAELLCAEPGSHFLHSQLQRWCSMCFSPATFICCTPQPSLISDGEEEVELEGCGLRLCVTCEVMLRELFNGDSSEMAAMMDLEPKAKAGEEDVVGRQVRADVGFLSREGLLMKFLDHDLTEGNGMEA
ncbi:hypothetical protein FB567DRAFT_590124 [Paraphoma chrysanthemicola]|uniref:Zn(2)-C6 fungal-type domain-containing protein n=1 Tax=Paraphoma chrysanthemicola TaxID=798071 RepID=A0A8K0RC87_9PLEO|nr:hypothetical protein FB567DRAFT_590124 [Paraphoma chrysanthemicola]